MILLSLNLFCKPKLILQLLKRFVKPFCVHVVKQISIQLYGDSLILNLINGILHSIFFIKCLLWSRGNDHTWAITYFVEKDSVLSHVLVISVYCHSPWSLVVQCVEHVCARYAEFSMNTKPIYVLPRWPRFISATADLKLLRQISSVRLLLKKRHTLVKVSWPIVHWVIDKGISVKMSSTRV
jgi:hypothetical protein